MVNVLPNYGYIFNYQWIYVLDLPIFFRVTPLELEQSYDCSSASEVTLKDMGKGDQNQTTTKWNNMQTVYKILGYIVQWRQKQKLLEAALSKMKSNALSYHKSCL